MNTDDMLDRASKELYGIPFRSLPELSDKQLYEMQDRVNLIRNAKEPTIDFLKELREL